MTLDHRPRIVEFVKIYFIKLQSRVTRAHKLPSALFRVLNRNEFGKATRIRRLRNPSHDCVGSERRWKAAFLSLSLAHTSWGRKSFFMLIFMYNKPRNIRNTITLPPIEGRLRGATHKIVAWQLLFYQKTRGRSEKLCELVELLQWKLLSLIKRLFDEK